VRRYAGAMPLKLAALIRGAANVDPRRTYSYDAGFFMGQLFFKKPMQEAIRAGQKSTTLRRWGKPRVRAGEHAFSPGLGWLAIQAVEIIELENLTDADARADGFETMAALLDVLMTLYPDQSNDGKHWFRIVFSLTERAAPRRKKCDGQPMLS